MARAGSTNKYMEIMGTILLLTVRVLMAITGAAFLIIAIAAWTVGAVFSRAKAYIDSRRK